MAAFCDRVVIVTGASAGIGREVCLALAEQRPKLALAARDIQRLNEVAAACQQGGAQTLVAATDVSQNDDCRRLIEAAVSRFGQIDALVNVAGRAMWGRFDELADLNVLDAIIRVNYLGSAYCSYHALPHLKSSKGLIVGVSSVAGMTGVPMLSGYSASKHAVMGFFESLRLEVSLSGVEVTIIAPDFVESEIFERAYDVHGRPLGRNPLDPGKFISAQRCARRIVKAMERREKLVLMSPRSKALRIGKILAPWLVDRLVARAVR